MMKYLDSKRYSNVLTCLMLPNLGRKQLVNGEKYFLPPIKYKFCHCSFTLNMKHHQDDKLELQGSIFSQKLTMCNMNAVARRDKPLKKNSNINHISPKNSIY